MAETKVMYGWTYEKVPGGWKKVAPVNQPPPNPKYPYEGPQAAATLGKTQAEIDAINAQTTSKNAELRFKQEEVARDRKKQIESKKIFARDALSGLRMLDRIDTDVRDTWPFWKDMVGEGFGETGASGAFMGMIPGTAAHDLRTNIEKVKGLSIMNKIVEAKSNMPPGAQGLFGATNAEELRALASALSNLNPDDSTENLLMNVGDARNAFLSVLRGSSPQLAKQYEHSRKSRKRETKSNGTSGWGQARVVGD